MNAACAPLGVAIAALCAITMVGCKVGPDYQRPNLATTMPTTYKSVTTQPATASLRQDWWTLFNDSDLVALEESAIKSNNDLLAAMQRVLQARAVAEVSGSAFYPTITANPQVTRTRSPLGSSGSSQSTSVSVNNDSSKRRAKTSNFAQVPFDLNYEIDLWGKYRRLEDVADADYAASLNDLAVVQQTVTADLAQDYFTIRSLDAQNQIIARNVELFRKQVELAQAQVRAGLVGQIDVLQAQTELDSTIAQQQDVQRQRADAEHAIAILIGRPPVELSIKADPLKGEPPLVPAGLPVDLLRQRPDVAEAEQNLIAANAEIGVAKANFYPDVQLTAAAGFESVDIRHTLDWQNRFWSIGPTASIPIFEGGKLTAQFKQAKARYEELVATYRGVILGAFRDVEDSLTDLRLRTDQSAATERAVVSARESVRLAEIQYKQGLTSYLQVIDADRTLLTNELSAAQIREQRMISAVLLIKAMGGGWSADAPAMAIQPIPQGPTTEPTR